MTRRGWPWLTAHVGKAWPIRWLLLGYWWRSTRYMGLAEGDCGDTSPPWYTPKERDQWGNGRKKTDPPPH